MDETVTSSVTVNSTGVLAEFVVPRTDTVAVSDTCSDAIVNAVRETLALAQVGDGLAQYVAAVLEALRLDERLLPVLEAVVADSVALTDSASAYVEHLVALIDSLVLAKTASTRLNALALLSEALAVADVVRMVQDSTVVDDLSLTEALEARVTWYEALLAELSLSFSADATAVFTVLLRDNAALADDGVGLQRLVEAINEGLAFSIAFGFAGQAYMAMAMNVSNKAVSEYTGYDYNSLATFNGVLYGAGEAGLYRLEGATDAGTAIDAYVRTALLRIGDGKQSQVDSVYLGYRASGALQLKVVTTEADGVKRGYIFDLVDTAPTAEKQNGRIKVGRGLKSAYWSFELRNVDGADFSLDTVEVRPLTLDRRIR